MNEATEDKQKSFFGYTPSSGGYTLSSGAVYYSNAPFKNYKPKHIIFIDNKTTKCVFEDGVEVFVEVKNGDTFDEEVGVALAIAHYLYRDEPKDKRKFLRAIKKIAVKASGKPSGKSKGKK